MSREMEDWAWSIRCQKSAHKLVLLCLARCHNAKTNQCFPSAAHICSLTALNKKTVYPAIEALVNAGLISVKKSFGERTSYFFNLTQKRVTIATEVGQKITEDPHPKTGHDSDGGGSKNHGRSTPKNGLGGDPKTGQDLTQKRVTNKGKNKEVTRNINIYSKFDFSSWPEKPGQQVMEDWLDMRKRKRAGVSQTVISNFGKELTKSWVAGFSVDFCLTECIVRGWQGFKHDWIISSQSNRKSGSMPLSAKLTDRSWAE